MLNFVAENWQCLLKNHYFCQINNVYNKNRDTKWHYNVV